MQNNNNVSITKSIFSPFFSVCSDNYNTYSKCRPLVRTRQQTSPLIDSRFDILLMQTIYIQYFSALLVRVSYTWAAARHSKSCNPRGLDPSWKSNINNIINCTKIWKICSVKRRSFAFHCFPLVQFIHYLFNTIYWDETAIWCQIYSGV